VNIADKIQISAELSRLIALQTEFFQRRNPTPAEIQENLNGLADAPANCLLNWRS
jgi:hypothetical protein